MTQSVLLGPAPFERSPIERSPFAALPVEERGTWITDYVRHLRRTDGEPDLEKRTLSKREAACRALEADPIPLERPLVDQAVFDRNIHRGTPEAGLDERMLWALAVAKASRAENYGIELKLRVKGFERAVGDRAYAYVELQELYHSRYLVTMLRAIGIVTEIHPPPMQTRFVVAACGSLPHFVSDVFALAAEVSAIVAFRMLLDHGRRLFADEPVSLARIEHLLDQLVTDELGHVRFLQARLGPVRLALARNAWPLVARGLLDDIPELVLLVGRRQYLRKVAQAAVEGPGDR
jgi:hypothetical protein